MDVYLGEIRVFPYPSIIPSGWVACNGQSMTVNQNMALFSLISNQFGGDGKTTFNLPKLNGRTCIGYGPFAGTPGYLVGNSGGMESVQLTSNNLPPHNHAINATDYYEVPAVNTNFLANTKVTSLTTGKNIDDVFIYKPAPMTNAVGLNPLTVDSAGDNGKHENRQPFLTMVYCIATQGIYPQRP